MKCQQFEKKLTILDTMHYIASAWDAVSSDTIANSFRHGGFKRSDACSTSEAAVSVDDKPEFGCLQLPGTFADYVSADDGVAVCRWITLSKLCALNLQTLQMRRKRMTLARLARPFQLTWKCCLSSTTFAGLLVHAMMSATCCLISQVSKEKTRLGKCREKMDFFRK
ncbi:hypothetical protein HPB50_023003 [Hyalomma asiaticum]|uniref:Uncharacterized protein n=1 Tax=Hyalomma asiaticum TaxID=266040 RepID=A0ACB7SYL3_HYAAI|nr:hypothetical protein HPB50_023003 [Hyalomma asiaticum]